MIKKIFLLLIFSLQIVFAQDVKEYIDRLLSNDTSEQISVFVYDPISMDTIYNRNIYENLIPASNIKLYTTATALSMLANRTYLVTKVFTDDINPGDSIINGNLYIKGYGDALLEERDLDSLITNINDLGIKKIDGQIIADESYFDKIYTRDDWITDERANVPLPPISGLSLDRNRIIVKFITSKAAGEKPDYEILPFGNFYNVEMNAKITNFNSSPRINFRTDEGIINIRIDGGIRKRKYPYSYYVHPDSPAVFIASLFRDKLIRSGIEITGNAVSEIMPMSTYELTSVRHKFLDLVNKVNKESDNYLAENLFKILGAEYSQKQGNSFYATQAVMTFLEEQDIFNKDITIVDGSGISRYNKTSTASIVNLLEYIYLDIEHFDFFYNSLSIAGRDGTLEDRLYESAAYENFRGKTGTLNGVSSISGYLTTKSNRDLIISILMNFKSKGQNYYRGIQDKIISYLAENL